MAEDNFLIDNRLLYNQVSLSHLDIGSGQKIDKPTSSRKVAEVERCLYKMFEIYPK